MYARLFSPFVITISLIFFTIPRHDAKDNEALYTECTRPFKCGQNNTDFKYPFWGEDRSSECGLQGFKLSCQNNEYISIDMGSDQKFRLLQIDESTREIRIAREYQEFCPPEVMDTKLNESLFYYNPKSTEDLQLFYGCPPDLVLPKSIDSIRNSTDQTCWGDWIPNSRLFGNQSFSQTQIRNLKSCGTKIRVPVNINTLEKLRTDVMMTLEEVLMDNFLVYYKIIYYETACSDCQDSGGLCWSGTNSSPPTCLCPEGTRTGRCKKKDKNVGLKIGIAAGAAAGTSIFIMLLVLFICYRRKKTDRGGSVVSRNNSSYPSSMSDSEKRGTYMGVQIFTYNELEKATNNFDSKNELGDGGFGAVYKGKLQDRRVVAVKRLYERNFKRVEQFMNEIEILTRLRHPNLVSLYGCTSLQCRQHLLVYEFIPNGTIADHLYGERAKPGNLTWKTRMSIAIETASALSYLHASDVIHRDVKTTNILLDNNFCVKVADFGLSRLFPFNVTHVSTAPQGTPGYLDPEYHQCYQLTDKSDVYSFGVVLIELISSMPAVDISRHRHEINLSIMAINKIQNDALHELVDPSLGFESDNEVRKTITEVAELAFQCLQNGRDFRPTMKEVLKILKGIQIKYFE